MALSKTNHALFEDIDKAMDQFVTLLIDHPTSADPERVKTAYNAYLEKLKQADLRSAIQLDWTHATQDLLGDFHGSGSCGRSASTILVGRWRHDSSSRFQLVVGVPQRMVHLAGDSVHPHLPDFPFLEMK